MSPLRRTGPPQRKTPLSSSTPLSRGTGLTRTPIARKAPQKPTDGPRTRPLSSARPKQTPEERAGRAAVKARSGGLCEIGSGCRGAEIHHRKNRSQGGTWCPSNLIHACRTHHLHVTTNPAAARQQGWAVRSTDDPARTAVWLAGRGFTYLNPDGSTVPAERSAA